MKISVDLLHSTANSMSLESFKAYLVEYKGLPTTDENSYKEIEVVEI